MDITINVYAFVGLVLLAIIGGLCVGVAGGLLVWFFYETGKQDRANKKEMEKLEKKIEQERAKEYEGMKQNLLKFFDRGSEQGATI